MDQTFNQSNPYNFVLVEVRFYKYCIYTYIYKYYINQ